MLLAVYAVCPSCYRYYRFERPMLWYAFNRPLERSALLPVEMCRRLNSVRCDRCHVRIQPMRPPLEYDVTEWFDDELPGYAGKQAPCS